MPGPARPKLNLPNVFSKNISNFSKPFNPHTTKVNFYSSIHKSSISSLENNCRRIIQEGKSLGDFQLSYNKLPQDYNPSALLAYANEFSRTNTDESAKANLEKDAKEAIRQIENTRIQIAKFLEAKLPNENSAQNGPTFQAFGG